MGASTWDVVCEFNEGSTSRPMDVKTDDLAIEHMLSDRFCHSSSSSDAPFYIDTVQVVDIDFQNILLQIIQSHGLVIEAIRKLDMTSQN